MTNLSYVSVRKTFGTNVALEGLDLDVHEGELITLLLDHLATLSDDRQSVVVTSDEQVVDGARREHHARRAALLRLDVDAGAPERLSACQRAIGLPGAASRPSPPMTRPFCITVIMQSNRQTRSSPLRPRTLPSGAFRRPAAIGDHPRTRRGRERPPAAPSTARRSHAIRPGAETP